MSFVRILLRADVAQLVEHFTRNEGVRSSNLLIGSTTFSEYAFMIVRIDSPNHSGIDGHSAQSVAVLPLFSNTAKWHAGCRLTVIRRGFVTDS